MTMIRTRIRLSRRALVVGGLAALLTALLLAANLRVAGAHQWSNYHWHKTGSRIVIQNYNYAAHYAEAEAARQDGWNKISILYNYNVNYHTDVSVFDGNFGATGWAGLATIDLTSGGHITHGHARVNTYYPMSSSYKQGVFCQELGHVWGLDHSATGDCMGLGYFAGSTSSYGAHNNSDFYNMYRYH